MEVRILSCVFVRLCMSVLLVYVHNCTYCLVLVGFLSFGIAYDAGRRYFEFLIIPLCY